MEGKVLALYDVEKTIAKDYMASKLYPWELLVDLKNYILKRGEELPKDKFDKVGEDVWIAKSCKVAKTAEIIGPCIIDEEAEIRHCAFLRGNVIIGKKCVVGNSTELKNAILFDCVQVPHFNYIGDSILGYHAHFGAGALTSNVKSDKSLVTIQTSQKKIETKCKKLGAIVGDFVEVGCNSVLCPGTIIGRNTTIYPLSMVRGVIESNKIYKSSSEIVEKRENKSI